MPARANNIRVLALDLRAGRFGFAALEGPHELLDWGTRRSRPLSTNDTVAFIRKRVSLLVKFYAPSVIVVRRTSGHGSGNSQQERLVDAVMADAERQNVDVILIERSEIRAAFAGPSQPTKHAIAGHVALAFPELAWKLPPFRKAWMNEAHMMTVFDAISLGLTYLSRLGDICPNDRQSAGIAPPG